MNGILTTAAAMLLSVHPVTAAAEDVARLAPDYAQYVRYIRLDDVDQEYRSTLIRLLCIGISGVSQSTSITPPWIVPNTKMALVRINTYDYGEQFARTYEKLNSPWDHQEVEDVQYNQPTTKVIEHKGGDFKAPDGKLHKNLAPGRYQVDVPGVKGGKNRRAKPGFWLTDTPQLAKEYDHLAGRLGGTNVAIVRGAWLLNRISAQQNRAPTGYNDFLGVKTEKDFQALGDFDGTKRLKRVEWRASVNFSRVTTQPRAIRRDGAPDSPYWRTFDFKLATKERNPLQIFGQDIEDAFRAADKADVASEQYILLPNDLWAVGAFANDGAAQEVAPNTVAGDKQSSSNDLQIHVGISCIRCHKTGGLLPITNWARNFFPPPLELSFKRLEEARLFREQYSRDLQKRLEIDRQAYTEAIKRWTGWTTEDYAAKLGAEWDRYENMIVDRKKLAAMLNTTEAELYRAIKLTVDAGNADRILSAVVINGDVVPIRQAEERVPVAHLALRGLQP